MADMRMAYLCERKGLPTLEAQRAALLAAGLTEAELAEAYVDRRARKPRPGEPFQPQRDYLVQASREGDEVWVSRAGVIATTREDALRFVGAISDNGATLCIAATGERFRVPGAAAAAVSDALRLAAAVAADERAAAMEKARAGGKRGRPAGKAKTPAEKIEAARVHWFDHSIDEDTAAARAGVGKRTLRRALGKRGSPAFGRAANMRRGKTT